MSNKGEEAKKRIDVILDGLELQAIDHTDLEDVQTGDQEVS